MNNKVSAFVFMLLSATVNAEQNDCSQYGREVAFPTVLSQGASICFVYMQVAQEDKGQLSQPADSVAVYSISDVGISPGPFELPYAGTAGKIIDAFLVFDENLGRERLYVIHSFVTPRAWEVTGDMYSVNVFHVEAGILVQDENYSRFFGFGGDLVRGETGLQSLYPFKKRVDVELAIRSPLARARAKHQEIGASVNEKAFLYEGGSDPYIEDESKEYLIKGDHVTVVDATSGWCKINYISSRKTGLRWMQCKFLDY